MSTTLQSTDRRDCVRLASGKKIEAVVMDQHGQPIELFSDAQVLNVSAGGLALISDAPPPTGSRMKIVVGDGPAVRGDEAPVYVETLECSSWRADRFKTRCRLVGGKIPAELIYGW